MTFLRGSVLFLDQILIRQETRVLTQPATKSFASCYPHRKAFVLPNIYLFAIFIVLYEVLLERANISLDIKNFIELKNFYI